MRRRRRALGLGLAALLLAGGLFRAVDDWHFRSERDELRRLVEKGRYAEARPRLARLAAGRPGDGELAFRLGICAWGIGRDEEAMAAWSRVPDGSPFAGQAAIRRARGELDRHRLAAAEELLPKALADRGDHARLAFETLLNLYKIEGRLNEALDLAWGYADRHPDPIAFLKEVALLGTFKLYEPEVTRGALETAYRAAPDDDRVWLGWANLATQVGRYDEASRWLDRCQRRRPEDVAVWRGRLNLAVASRDAEGALAAVAHLPEAAVRPEEALSLLAWSAEVGSDVPKERRALAELLALEPANFRALERLAELELRSGRADEAARLRARRAELDRVHARYVEILFLPDAPARAVELARLAEELGRAREARMLWALAHDRNPGDPAPAEALARLGRAPPPPSAAGTLAALRAERADGGRPASAGRSSPSAATRPAFVDDAEPAGLRFVFDSGATPLRLLPHSMSGGLGLLDFDGDGRLDVYCVQGVSTTTADGRKGGDRLFRNRGDGTFLDVSAASGIEAMPRGYGHGVAVGDFDNDGRPDLFVTRMDTYALYRNKGDGTFEDVTGPSGLGGFRDWPTSAAFADLDGDGDLDLYVCHYVEWDSRNPRACHDKAMRAILCEPRSFRPKPDHLFRNEGGRFVDVTAEAGLVDARGEGLGVVACDFDQDGRIDLFVANDQSANLLYRNLGGLRFEEVGEASGVGTSGEGHLMANMGVACGDPDGDGLPDLVVTEYYNEGATYYQNLGGGVFSDHSQAVGLTAPTRSMLGFGIVFLDYDADGRLDLAIANGHVDDLRPSTPYRMRPQLLAGTRDGRFVEVTGLAGPPWQVPHLGRGLASGDLDNDGRVDLVLLSQDEPLAYLHNKTAGGHWLTLRLEGTASNRDAVGARVTVTAGGRRRTSWRFGGGSYQSASDSRLHFGLGPADRAERVEVAWPSGRVDRHDGLPADAAYLIREGDSRPAPLPGYTR